MEFTRPRGTRDFLFDEMRQRKKAESTLRNIFENYGYQEIKTPLFEELKLFTTKSGEEIVNQKYVFGKSFFIFCWKGLYFFMTDVTMKMYNYAILEKINERGEKQC